MKYKIGQIFKTTKDVELVAALSETKTMVRKGTEIIIGADRLAHHIRSGIIQPLAKDSEVGGFDAEGIAKYLYIVIGSSLPLDEMLEGFDLNGEDFKSEIECALKEIGF